jgi:hypothetical protein
MSLSYISNFDPSQCVSSSPCYRYVAPKGLLFAPGSRSFDQPQTFSLIVSLGNLLSGEVGLNLIQLLCKTIRGWFDGSVELQLGWAD